MTTFRKYLWYNFKKALPLCAAIAVLSAILSILLSISKVYHFLDFRIPSEMLATPVLMCSMVAAMYPIIELSQFKNRRNIDTILFMPISRTKMAMAHWLNSVLQISIINFVSVFAMALIYPYDLQFYAILRMLLVFLVSCLLCMMLYSIFSFIFMRANTVADGVIFMVIYSCIGMIIANGFCRFFEIKPLFLNYSYFFPLSPVMVITEIIESLDHLPDKYVFENFFEIFGFVEPEKCNGSWTIGTISLNFAEKFALIFWPIIGALSFVGYILGFSMQKPERIGDVSDSPFGYRVLLPVCALFGFLIVSKFNTCMLTFIALLIGYAVYLRGSKPKTADIVSFAATSLFAVARFMHVLKI